MDKKKPDSKDSKKPEVKLKIKVKGYHKTSWYPLTLQYIKKRKYDKLFYTFYQSNFI